MAWPNVGPIVPFGECACGVGMPSMEVRWLDGGGLLSFVSDGAVEQQDAVLAVAALVATEAVLEFGVCLGELDDGGAQHDAGAAVDEIGDPLPLVRTVAFS